MFSNPKFFSKVFGYGKCVFLFHLPHILFPSPLLSLSFSPSPPSPSPSPLPSPSPSPLSLSLSLSLSPTFSNSRRLEELIDEEVGGRDDELDEEGLEVEEVVGGTLDKWRNECESKLGIRLAACRFFESWTTKGIRKRESMKFLGGDRSRFD